MLGLSMRSLCPRIFTRKDLKDPDYIIWLHLSWTRIRPIPVSDRTTPPCIRLLHSSAILYISLLTRACIAQGFPKVEVSSCPVGKHKCNISGRHSVMYLSTFSFPFQIGIVNSGDEWVSGWEKSPSCTRELTCQCPLLTRTSLACCYESTDISTFTLT